MRKSVIPYIFIFVLSFLLLGIFAYKTIVAVNTSSSIATIYVDPHTSVGTIGQNFTVDINISNVTDLYGWELKLGWNSTILDAVNVVEGSFLKRGGNTFFAYKINNTEGFGLVDCTLLGNVPGVSGNGTLATIEFHVKTLGECTLDLYDTTLVSSAEQPIPHTAFDGYYYTALRDVAVINLVASATTVNVTVENKGNHFTETFNVSAYYTLLTDPLIGTQTITLEPGETITLNFTWTPNATGRYEIKAYTSTIPNDVDPSDNTKITYLYVSATYTAAFSTEENDWADMDVRGGRFYFRASPV